MEGFNRDAFRTSYSSVYLVMGNGRLLEFDWVSNWGDKGAVSQGVATENTSLHESVSSHKGIAMGGQNKANTTRIGV